MANKQLQRKSTKWLQVLEDRSNINYLTVIEEQFAGSYKRICHVLLKFQGLFWTKLLDNELKEIFDYIDVDADGFISLTDLEMVIRELLPKLSQDDIRDMFSIVPKSNRNQIAFPWVKIDLLKFRGLPLTYHSRKWCSTNIGLNFRKQLYCEHKTDVNFKLL